MLQTSGKTALITGAAGGLGVEFALQLAAKGYNLVLTSRRAGRLHQLADSIRAKFAVQVTVYPADLSKMPDIEQLVSIISGLPSLDMVVNNAGFGTVGSFVQVDPAKELAMLNVHVIAPVLFCRAALPGRLARKQGAIINVASLAALIPIRNVVYYSSKAFLVSFSTILRAELQGTQVHVQALCPDFVYTDFHDTPEYSRSSRQGVPRFLWMTPPQVVSTSLRSLNGRQLICIPGNIYRLAGVLARNSLSAGLIRFAALFILRKRRIFITPK